MTAEEIPSNIGSVALLRRLSTKATRKSTADFTKETEASEPHVWHPYYNDPILDVVLKSSDNVYFRASSHVLKRESTLFLDMLSIQPNLHMTTLDAMSLNFDSITITLFLDCYTFPGPARYQFGHQTVTLHQAREYRKLIQLLDCDRLMLGANSAYQDACHLDPIAWLSAASEDDDVEEATLALSYCGKDHVELDSTSVFDLVWRMRTEWHHPLLRCLISEVTGGGWQKAGLLRISWPDGRRIQQFFKDVEKGRQEKQEGA